MRDSAQAANQVTNSAVDHLIHDVNSKCLSLKDASALLKTISPTEAQELLALMAAQAQSLAKTIAAFECKAG